MLKKHKRSNGRRTKLGLELEAALTEIKEALQSGEPLEKRFKVRIVEVIEPGVYDPAAIKATRAGLKVSQAMFARIVGVSKVLVQSWEAGVRVPNTMARRVLDEVNREPKHWARFIGPVKPSGRRVA